MTRHTIGAITFLCRRRSCAGGITSNFSIPTRGAPATRPAELKPFYQSFAVLEALGAERAKKKGK
jgi:hypothetical protein